MKKKLKLCALLLTFSMLGGCTLKSGDELLAAPQPTKNYQALQTELKKVLDAGRVIYASPESGENRSTVQLKDLDHDGEDEAIAFFRGSDAATSNKFTVIVYKKIGEQYLKMGSVSGSGLAIESVEYPTFTPDGKCGIIISWRLAMNASGRGLTVCGFENSSKVVPLLETDYLAYELRDLTGDGAQELVAVSADVNGKKLARMYVYANGTVRSSGDVPLAADAKTIDRMTPGYAANHQPAVFIEEKNDNGIGLMTDILVYDAQQGFRNIAPVSGQNALYSTYRPVSVYAADANNDGITEIPRASLMAGFESGAPDALYFLDWFAYGGAQPVRACTTYNSPSEEWKLTVPDSWRDAVTVSRTSSSAGMNCTTFEAYVQGGTNIPLLSIYYMTGDLRSYLADNANMRPLRQTSSAIYTASVPPEAAGSAIAITLEEAEARFSLISQGWVQ